LRRIKEQILEFDRLIRAWHRSNEMSMRLDEAPGVGPVLATAVVAAVADPKSFRSGRNFSAWIGIVPKQHSSGGKNRLGNISKQGDRYLRGLFVIGALAVIRYAKILSKMARSAPVFADLHWRANGANQNCCSSKEQKSCCGEDTRPPCARSSRLEPQLYSSRVGSG
jgi:transposase